MIERRSAGFSLLELVLVLIIVSLLTLLVTPTLNKSLRHMELKSMAKRISAILRTCRNEAVNKSRIYLIHLDAGSNLVSVSSASKGDDKPKMETSYPFPRDVKVEKIEVGKTLFEDSISSFEFYPNGASNGGSAILRGVQGKGYSIHVDFLTGMVKVEGTQ